MRTIVAAVVTALVAAVVALVSPSALAQTPSPASAAGTYHPVVPARILDTRDGSSPPAARSTVTLPVLGRGGVPAAGVTAVVLNVTATASDAPGFVTAHPGRGARPDASSLNHLAGQTVANLVTVDVGPGGSVSLYRFAATHLVADVQGYVSDAGLPAGARYVAVDQQRLLDTREAGRRTTAGGTTRLDVLGRGGIPDTGVVAVVLNATVTGSAAPGWVSVLPGGASRPLVSSLNHATGQTVANRVVVGVGATGAVDVVTQQSTHVVVDVSGYWTTVVDAAQRPATFTGVTPYRVLDTRSDSPAFRGGETRAVRLTGPASGGVPASRERPVTAVVVTITVLALDTDGFLTAFAHDAQRPLASDVNSVAGAAVPNTTLLSVGPDGVAQLYVAGSITQVVVDVVGYLAAPPAPPVVVPDPDGMRANGGVATRPGTVVAWGEASGLGSGTTDSSPVPVDVPGLTGVVALAGNNGGALALTEDGHVWGWGFDGYTGNLGTGVAYEVPVPTLLPGLREVVAIAGAGLNGFALTRDGRVWGWGPASGGQLGTGQDTTATTPVVVNGLSRVTAIAATTGTGYALTTAGEVWAWGSDGSGRLGNGSEHGSSPVPGRVLGLTDVTSITGSWSGASAFAITRDGQLWAWGNGAEGALGDGRRVNAEVPVAVSGMTAVVAVAASGRTGYALDRSGQVFSWGDGRSGQLGTGSTADVDIPVAVAGLDDVTAIAAGASHASALTTDGQVWTWGPHWLGNGSGSGSSSPVRVTGVTSAVALSWTFGGYAVTA